MSTELVNEVNGQRSEATQYLAVYGTLKKGYGNHIYLHDQEYYGSGYTVDSYSMRSWGIPMVYKDPAIAPVGIELYGVTEDRLTGPIDRLEGHPRFYKREKIKVVVSEKAFSDVWLYFAGNDDVDPYGDPVEPLDGVITWAK